MRRLVGVYDAEMEAKATPVVPILFYRSMLLAADAAPIDALAAELRAKGIAAIPIWMCKWCRCR